MRTYISTFVTLNTIFWRPFWNKCSYTTFFVFSSTLWPSSIFDPFKCRNRKKVTILSIDWANYFVDECWVIICNDFIIRQISPTWVYSQLFIFTTTVNCCIVFVYNILSFFAVRLYNELFHLFDSQINRNYTCNTEKCRL